MKETNILHLLDLYKFPWSSCNSQIQFFGCRTIIYTSLYYIQCYQSGRPQFKTNVNTWNLWYHKNKHCVQQSPAIVSSPPETGITPPAYTFIYSYNIDPSRLSDVHQILSILSLVYTDMTHTHTKKKEKPFVYNSMCILMYFLSPYSPLVNKAKTNENIDYRNIIYVFIPLHFIQICW